MPGSGSLTWGASLRVVRKLGNGCAPGCVCRDDKSGKTEEPFDEDILKVGQTKISSSNLHYLHYLCICNYHTIHMAIRI
jgi:hypothetical protein